MNIPFPKPERQGVIGLGCGCLKIGTLYSFTCEPHISAAYKTWQGIELEAAAALHPEEEK